MNDIKIHNGRILKDTEKECKIVIYNPIILLGKRSTELHGYAVEFIKNYVDYVYIANPRIMRKIKNKITELMPQKEIKCTMSIQECNQKCDVMVGFHTWRFETRLDKFTGLKVFHLLDYYLDVEDKRRFLLRNKIDFVIGYTQMDKFCPFFKKYYAEWIGKSYDLPYGYDKRFQNKVNFEQRINRAVGLGSINPVDDPLCRSKQKKQLVDFFGDKEYQHETRRYLQMHAEQFSGIIDAKFPPFGKQKDFSYDAVAMMNAYKMFINDEGVANFPPARTFEGIASGTVMVAAYNEIYSDLGFIPDYNYIAFEKGNYTDLKEKITYYMMHDEKLKQLQKNSLILAHNYSHQEIAKKLFMFVQEEKVNYR